MESREDHEEGTPTKEEDVMKKIGEYTVRGRIPIAAESNDPIKIQLFDGRFDTGFRITKFRVAGVAMGDGNGDCIAAKLVTDPSATPGGDWQFDDNSEIAWSMCSYAMNGTLPFGTNEIIDKDNMIIEDLYIYVNTFGEGGMNYIIEMEKYDINDWQGALSMVRNKSQG